MSHDFIVTDLERRRVRFCDSETKEVFGPEMSFDEAVRVNAVLEAIGFTARHICNIPRNNDEGCQMDSWLEDLDAVEDAAGAVVRGRR